MKRLFLLDLISGGSTKGHPRAQYNGGDAVEEPHMPGWEPIRTPEDHQGWSFGSAGSLFSFRSVLSALSAGSILSIGSAGSILSIGSEGSVLGLGVRRRPKS